MGYEVTNYNFAIHKEQPQDQGGTIFKQVNAKLKFKENEEEMHVYASQRMDAFCGENEGAEEDKVFSANIETVLRYSLKNTESSPSQITRHKWFFDSQAALLLNALARDIMKDTRFKIGSS